LELGSAAIAIATAHGLWHAAVPVHFTLGGGLAGAQRLKEAEAEYTAAEAMALRGEREGPDEARAACAPLRVQARLGLGSVRHAAAGRARRPEGGARLPAARVLLLRASRQARARPPLWRGGARDCPFDGRTDARCVHFPVPRGNAHAAHRKRPARAAPPAARARDRARDPASRTGARVPPGVGRPSERGTRVPPA